MIFLYILRFKFHLFNDDHNNNDYDDNDDDRNDDNLCAFRQLYEYCLSAFSFFFFFFADIYRLFDAFLWQNANKY